jgi:hypothetical protein
MGDAAKDLVKRTEPVVAAEAALAGPARAIAPAVDHLWD